MDGTIPISMPSHFKEASSEPIRVKPTTHELILQQLSNTTFSKLTNGVDTRYPPKKEPNRNTGYEDICFEEIARRDQNPNSFFIGPHFIDMFFTKQFNEKFLGFPDAMKFNIDDREEWVLEDLYEFKSGKAIGSTAKFKGFSKLLTRMREKDELPDLLNKTLIPDGIIPLLSSFPKKIIIPLESEISVTFASTHLSGDVIFDKNNGYKQVNHIRIPNQPSK